MILAYLAVDYQLTFKVKFTVTPKYRTHNNVNRFGRYDILTGFKYNSSNILFSQSPALLILFVHDHEVSFSIMFKVKVRVTENKSSLRCKLIID